MVTRPAGVAGDAAETRERLRRLIRRLESRPARGRALPPTERRPAHPIESVFPHAVRRETASGRFVFIQQTYPLDHYVGARTLADLRHLSTETLALLSPDEEVREARTSDLLFLDIETTGLGGAGAVAFLVATARIEQRGGVETFVLRQYLASSPAEEAAVMAALIDDCALGDDPVLVTYNGRAFDAPLLDERATMHRTRAGFDALRHLDLLAPVRTGLRGMMESCRLAVVESDLLQLTRPSTEIDGSAVPTHYFRFLRTGDARLLVPLVEHNAQDVVSLGALLGRFAALERGAASPTALDAVALGRLHAARGAGEPAARRLQQAATLLPASAARDDVLRRLARLHRRQGRRDLALPLWREIAGGGRGARLDVLVEIAKHLEHDCRDFAAAIEAVDEALAVIDGIAQRLHVDAARHRDELLHRRARLSRRMSQAECPPPRAREASASWPPGRGG